MLQVTIWFYPLCRSGQFCDLKKEIYIEIRTPYWRCRVTSTLQEQIPQIVEAEKAGFDNLWPAHIMDIDTMTMLSLATD